MADTTTGMVNIQFARRPVELLPGRSLHVLLRNSLALMRAGASKQLAMQQALNHAGYRPPSKAGTMTVKTEKGT